MKIAYVILAHDQPAQLARLITLILNNQPDDEVFLHWDLRSRFDIGAYLKNHLDEEVLRRTFFQSTVQVKWGMWSIVEATLSCLTNVLESDKNFDYVLLMSGHDYPIKPIATLKEFLAAHQGTEFIECVHADERQWVIGGIYKERYLYRHFFSYRTPTLQFRWSLGLQQKLGLKRKFPKGFEPHFGSQWWGLTFTTIKKIVAFSNQPEINNFFKYTCIPDELFFQTLVAGLVPSENIYGSNLTFYKFTPSGKPYIFYNDHFEFLTNQDYFFARKLSPDALILREKIDYYCQQKLAAPQELGQKLSAIHEHEKTEYLGINSVRAIAHTKGNLGDLSNIQKHYLVFVCDTYDLSALIGEIIESLGYRSIYIGMKHLAKTATSQPGTGLFPIEYPELAEHDLANFLSYLIKRSPEKLPCLLVRRSHELVKLVEHHQKARIIHIEATLEFNDKQQLCHLLKIIAGTGSTQGWLELLRVTTPAILDTDPIQATKVFQAVLKELNSRCHFHDLEATEGEQA